MADDLVPPHRENNVITWKSRDLLGRIGMVFQEPEHQFAASTVRDEVAIGPKSMGKTDEEAYSIADRLLERLNLSRFAKANPFTLSGGEKKKTVRGVHAGCRAKSAGHGRADIRTGFHHVDQHGPIDRRCARPRLRGHHDYA